MLKQLLYSYKKKWQRKLHNQIPSPDHLTFWTLLPSLATSKAHPIRNCISERCKRIFYRNSHIKDLRLWWVNIWNSQWNKCFARVSFGINSATSSLSSPSQQHPIRFANRSLLRFPTALASSFNSPTRNITWQDLWKLKKFHLSLAFKNWSWSLIWRRDHNRACVRITICNNDLIKY